MPELGNISAQVSIFDRIEDRPTHLGGITLQKQYSRYGSLPINFKRLPGCEDFEGRVSAIVNCDSSKLKIPITTNTFVQNLAYDQYVAGAYRILDTVIKAEQERAEIRLVESVR